MMATAQAETPNHLYQQQQSDMNSQQQQQPPPQQQSPAPYQQQQQPPNYSQPPPIRFPGKPVPPSNGGPPPTQNSVPGGSQYPGQQMTGSSTPGGQHNMRPGLGGYHQNTHHGPPQQPPSGPTPTLNQLLQSSGGGSGGGNNIGNGQMNSGPPNSVSGGGGGGGANSVNRYTPSTNYDTTNSYPSPHPLKTDTQQQYPPPPNTWPPSAQGERPPQPPHVNNYHQPPQHIVDQQSMYRQGAPPGGPNRSGSGQPQQPISGSHQQQYYNPPPPPGGMIHSGQYPQPQSSHYQPQNQNRYPPPPGRPPDSSNQSQQQQTTGHYGGQQPQYPPPPSPSQSPHYSQQTQQHQRYPPPQRPNDPYNQQSQHYPPPQHRYSGPQTPMRPGENQQPSHYHPVPSTGMNDSIGHVPPGRPPSASGNSIDGHPPRSTPPPAPSPSLQPPNHINHLPPSPSQSPRSSQQLPPPSGPPSHSPSHRPNNNYPQPDVGGGPSGPGAPNRSVTGQGQPQPPPGSHQQQYYNPPPGMLNSGPQYPPQSSHYPPPPPGPGPPSQNRYPPPPGRSVDSNQTQQPPSGHYPPQPQSPHYPPPPLSQSPHYSQEQQHSSPQRYPPPPPRQGDPYPPSQQSHYPPPHRYGPPPPPQNQQPSHYHPPGMNDSGHIPPGRPPSASGNSIDGHPPRSTPPPAPSPSLQPPNHVNHLPPSPSQSPRSSQQLPPPSGPPSHSPSHRPNNNYPQPDVGDVTGCNSNDSASGPIGAGIRPSPSPTGSGSSRSMSPAVGNQNIPMTPRPWSGQTESGTPRIPTDHYRSKIKKADSLNKLYEMDDNSDRRIFLDKLLHFMEEVSSPITACPQISKNPLDLFKLYYLVKERGGFLEVTRNKTWKDIAGSLGIGASSSAAYTLRKHYTKHLLPFECKFDRGGIDPQPLINQVEQQTKKKGSKAPPVPSPGSSNSQDSFPGPNSGNNTGSMDSFPGYPSPYPGGSSTDYSNQQTPQGPSPQQQQLPPPSGPSQGQGQGPPQGPPPQTNQTQPPQHPGEDKHNVSVLNPFDDMPIQQSSTNTNIQNTNITSSFFHHQQQTPSQGYQNPTGNYSPYPPPPQPGDQYGRGPPPPPPHLHDQYPSQQQQQYTQQYPQQSTRQMYPVYTPPTQSPSPQPTWATTGPPQPPPQIQIPPSPRGPMGTPPTPIPPWGSHSGGTVMSPQPNQNQQSGPPQPSPSQWPQHQRQQIRPPFPPQPPPGGKGSEMYKTNYQSNPPPSGMMPPSGPIPIPLSSSLPLPVQVPKGPPPIAQLSSMTQHQPSQHPTHPPTTPGTSPGVFSAPPPTQFSQLPMAAPSVSIKKEIIFPSDSVENTQPVILKRRKLNKNDVSPIEPWRIMMSLKSGLLAETTWALDVLNVLLYDDYTVTYFSLNYLPGLLDLILEHLRRYLVIIFGQSVGIELPSDIKEDNTQETVERKWYELRKRKPSTEVDLGIPFKKFDGSNQSRTNVLTGPNYTLKTRSSKPIKYLSRDDDLFVCPGPRDWDLDEKSRLAGDADVPTSSVMDLTCHVVTSFRTDLNIVPIIRLIDSKSQKKKEDNEFKSDESEVIVKIESSDSINLESSSSDQPLNLQLYQSYETKKANESILPLIPKLTNPLPISNGLEDSLSNSSSTSRTINCILKEKKGKLRLHTLDVEENTLIEPPTQHNHNNRPNGKGPAPGPEFLNDNAVMMNGIENESSNQSLTSTTENSSSDFCDSNNTNTTNKQSIQQETPNNNENPENSLSGVRNSHPVVVRDGGGKRKRMDEYEDECFTRDEGSLGVITESEDSLSRRCLSILNILRNLTFVPGNDIELGKSSTFLSLIGKLILLHHDHPLKSNSKSPTTKKKRIKVEDEIGDTVLMGVGEDDCVNGGSGDDESDENIMAIATAAAAAAATIDSESCTSLNVENHWWWDSLHHIREHVLVMMSNISGQVDLSQFSEEVSRPILDGLLHWAVCPAAYGQDPFPTVGIHSNSTLSPRRLAIEALCKLSVTQGNVDLLLATPPYSRIERLCQLLSRGLCRSEDQVVREFSINLLSYLSGAESGVARTIALQTPSISLLIAYIEQAEVNARNIVENHGFSVLRENPESMGTSLDMLRRAATTLHNLAKHPDNRPIFVQHEPRLLQLVMSQILEQKVAAIVAQVLFTFSAPEGSVHAKYGSNECDSGELFYTPSLSRSRHFPPPPHHHSQQPQPHLLPGGQGYPTY